MKPGTFPGLETGRCRLRWFRESDLEAFTDYRADPDVARYQSWSSYTYEDALALYRDLLHKPFGVDGAWYQIAIADRKTDALLGDLALHFVEPGVAELGFTIAPANQGRGLAREAVRGMLRYLFDEWDYRRVRAVTDVKNRPSIGLLEALGFRRAAGAPRKVIFKGEPGEEFDYFIAREDWDGS